MTSTSEQQNSAPTSAKVVVATTVALSFITFWRGASIVLCDLASSSFYAGGIAEQAIGRSAPWFVLAVMLFAFAVRSVYVESCSMFVRGGVYVVVRNSMGRIMALLSVSALVFDFILTGPISGVSAGHYLGRLLNEFSDYLGLGWHLSPSLFATLFALAVTVYFWWGNIQGMHESSSKALRIMQTMTVMVVILVVWCLITLLLQDEVKLPPLPTAENLQFTGESLGWLHNSSLVTFPFVAILIAFGHSFLSMSGFETLAQVYREIGFPKMRNLRLTANIVCGYALVSTGLITLFAGMIIPDGERARYVDNLIGGLSMHLAGPDLLRLVFHAFVVIVGVMILSGAINTSMIGSNGVLNRVAEDGVLTDWFRRPHSRYGTTYRIINAVTLLQIVTILASRGDVYLLGEAYAFGVVWSFFFKSLGVLVLRFQRTDQEYKTPLNPRIAGREWPVGLFITTLALFFVAIANLFTKQVATIYGVLFTVGLFVLFTASEHINLRKKRHHTKALEEFNLVHAPEVATSNLRARPGCGLVAVRDYHRLTPLQVALERTNLRRHDIVVMTARSITHAGEYELDNEQLFTDYEKELFSRVVEMAERMGKPVSLLVVPAVDPFDAMVRTAATLKAARLITGVSARMTSEELARQIGLAWERLEEPRHPFALEILSQDRPALYVNLGPHPPRLWPEDVDLLHDMWLGICDEQGVGSKLHHRDVVSVALKRLQRDLEGDQKDSVVQDILARLKTPEKG